MGWFDKDWKWCKLIEIWLTFDWKKIDTENNKDWRQTLIDTN